MIHRRFRGFAVFALAPVVAIACLAGCTDKPKPDTVDASPSMSATPAASSGAMLGDGGMEAGAEAMAEPPRRGGVRGAGGAIFQSARAQGFPPDLVKKVDDAEAIGSAPPDPAMKDATKDLHTELVSEIKAGKIDSSKLEPKYAAIEKLAQAEHDLDGDAVNALHDALDATQRKTVAEAARATITKREEHMLKVDAGMAMADAGAKPSMAKRSMDRLLRGIDIDSDEQKKLDAAVPKDDPKMAPDPADMKKKADAMCDAFEKDKLDAKKVDPFDQKKARAGLEAETKVLAAIVPILKPEQRDKLAMKMEKGGENPHGGRRPGLGRRPEVEQESDPN